MAEKAFDFIHKADRPDKPRTVGLTEIRAGGYPIAEGSRTLEDKLEVFGEYIDLAKFAAGSFAIMDREDVIEIIDVCHKHNVEVNTGGFIETIIAKQPDKIEDFLQESKNLGFDVVEISSGYVSVDQSTLIELTELTQEYDLKPKPEVGDRDIERATTDADRIIDEAKRHLDAGAYKIMVEEDGITEESAGNAKPYDEWNTDLIFEIADRIGIENCVFEASDPEVFEWYITNFGPNVNLFIDGSQIVKLEVFRRGLWGSARTWGRTGTI